MTPQMFELISLSTIVLAPAGLFEPGFDQRQERSICPTKDAEQHDSTVCVGISSTTCEGVMTEPTAVQQQLDTQSRFQDKAE